MRWARGALWAFGAVAALLIRSDTALAQCAMCRTALLNSPEGQIIAAGFNRGILFLFAAPFLVAGTIAFLIFRSRVGALSTYPWRRHSSLLPASRTQTPVS